MLNIQIILFDGFDLMDVIGPYEVFMAAKMLSGSDLHVNFVSAEGERFVKSGMNGPVLSATGPIDQESAGILLIPGAMGKVGPEEDTGPDAVVTQLLKARETRLMPLLRQAMQNENLTISTVCGGAMLLAMDGLLKDRYAVTHVLGMEVLGALGAKPVPARVVVDGRLVTGGGVTSGLDVALYLVERELGPRVAHAVEKLFEYERRGITWRAEGLIPVNGEAKTHSIHSTPEASREETTSTSNDYASFDGAWKVTIYTPIGKQNVIFQISTNDGVVKGTAKQGLDVVEFVNPVVTGNRMTWSQRVTKPLSLNLKFEITVNGNSVVGIAKAGLLPPSKVEGTRMEYTNEEC
jgi:putative intracellular protease/amidase